MTGVNILDPIRQTLEQNKGNSMKSHSRARPIRIAYLVEESDHWNLILDAIAQASFGAWGGRFYMVVPCKDGAPLEEFMPWLNSYDPDIIYSYCDLTDEVISSLHETIYPAFLIRHQDNAPKPSRSSFLPNLPTRPLTVETIIPYAAIPSKYQGQRAPILDMAHGAASSDVFIQTNFGEFARSTGHSFPQYLNEFSTPIHILSENELQPRQRYGLSEIFSIEDRSLMLKEMANKRILTVANLSSFGASRLNISQSKWSMGFNIVVGDSFVDRVTFWNSRALFPAWRDGDHVDLYVPERDTNDKKLLNEISEFIRKRNSVSRDSGNSSPQAILRSHSIKLEKLRELAVLLKGSSPWIQYSTESIQSIFDHIPSKENLGSAYFASPNSFLSKGRGGWTESETLSNEIRIPPSLPDHFQHASPVLTSSNMGAWAVELIIPRSNDLSQHTNVSQSWILPRRLRITPAFKRGYRLSGNMGFVMPRVSSGDFLCLLTNSRTDTVVNIPTDEAAIRTGFQGGRDWLPFVAKHDGTSEMPSQLAYEVERSSNGLYFWGVLNMFGGLAQIRNHLLHGFWRNQFELLGASSSRTDERRRAVSDVLKKRLRKLLDAPISDSLDALAERVLEEAELHRTRLPAVEWTELQKSHALFSETYWEKHPPGGDEADILNWKDDQKSSLGPSVQRLCKMGIFHQGYEMKCPKCLHRFWISIDALKSMITCEVCNTPKPAPVGLPWAFRLNEFFREALRAHGVLPLFWALQKSRAMDENSFFFEGPLNVYFSKESFDQRQPDTDVDLTVISNGIVQMFEVKQSERQLQKAIEFASVAKRLRPDIAAIAIMAPMSKLIERKYGEFVDRLAGTGIKPQLITLDPENDFSNNPSLNETFSVRVF